VRLPEASLGRFGGVATHAKAAKVSLDGLVPLRCVCVEVCRAELCSNIGFGNVGVRTALSTGAGGFAQAQLAAPDFGYWARPW
jgi:hypothetical protein